MPPNVTTILPFGWVIREVRCCVRGDSTFEIYFEGRLMDDRATYEQAIEFIAEIRTVVPKKGLAKDGLSKGIARGIKHRADQSDARPNKSHALGKT